jgi:hypothetical protein
LQGCFSAFFWHSAGMKFSGKWWVCSWICLLATAAFGGDGVASFAKESLGIDLASIPFGKSIQTNSGYGITEPPLSVVYSSLTNNEGISWMTNAVSAKYTHDFTNRVLRFGFFDGRLAVIRISISAFVMPGQAAVMSAGNSDQATAERKLFGRRRAELLQIQGDLYKARQEEKSNIGDDFKFDVLYGAMCAPSPESLFVSEIQISPVATKKTP